LKGEFNMQSFSDTQEVTLICNDCGLVEKGTVNTNIVTDLPLLAFETRVYAECPTCGNVCSEIGSLIAEPVSVLIDKNYRVLRSNQCEYGENLYDPYIKIRVGLNKLTPPEGWEDVTGAGVHSFQVFAPIRSYGTAAEDADVEKYAVKTMFPDEGDFNIARTKYINQLMNWAIGLPENTDITTLKNVKSQIGGDNDN
jgi:hypothetical protein